MLSTNSLFRLSCVPVLALLTFFSANAVEAQKDDFDREGLKVKDSVLLKSGTTLHGFVKSEGVEEGRKFVIFETTDGTVIKIDLARMVFRGRIHRLDDIDQDYNKYISTLADEPDAHWEMFDWLEAQPSGTVRFKDQIQFHLERIMELDPNDEKAKRELGYTYIRSQDRWVPEDQYHQSLGYVKQGTSWAPKRQAELSARHETNESIEGQRKLAFRRWEKDASRANANVATLRAELFQICDEPAVPIIFDAARDENDPRKRALFIDAIGRVPNKAAQNALCIFAIEEDVQGNRERALALLSQDHYNRDSTVGFLSRYLVSASRPQVLRSAFAIGELGSESAILPLVGALVTQHQVKPGDQPGRMQTGVSSNGNVESFSVGGDSAPVIQNFQNQEAVNALKSISGQDFGYDAAAWRNWYIKSHTHYDVKVRR